MMYKRVFNGCWSDRRRISTVLMSVKGNLKTYFKTGYLLQVTAVFVRNDKDGDGKLSKEEFKEMMCRDKKVQEN
jgi:Ca2+-binding EF-hand superfamily protein